MQMQKCYHLHVLEKLHTFSTLAIDGGHPCIQRHVRIKPYNVRYILKIL